MFVNKKGKKIYVKDLDYYDKRLEEVGIRWEKISKNKWNCRYKIGGKEFDFIVSNPYYKEDDGVSINVLANIYVDKYGRLFMIYNNMPDRPGIPGKVQPEYTKTECDFYILVYNTEGKIIAEIPIRKYKYTYGAPWRNPPGNIFITDEGIVYEMYADKEGIHIFKWTL